MNPDPIIRPDTGILKVREDYVLETALQIQKDFESCALSFRLPPKYPLNYEKLFLKVKKEIEKLTESNYEKLLALMYRIDIPDTDYKRLTQSPYFADILTETVIKKGILKSFDSESLQKRTKLIPKI